MTPNPQGLGSLLLEAGLIDESQLAAALSEQTRTGERLGAVLVRLETVTEAELARILSKQLDIRLFDPGRDKIQPEALAAVPADLARKYNVLPLGFDGQNVQVAMADHGVNLSRVGAELRAVTHLDVSREDVLVAIEKAGELLAAP